MSGEIYTLGIWTVKPGFEEEFRRAWSEFANATHARFEGAVSVVLLQDAEDPRRFISMGPWRSQADIDEWRGSDGFKDAIALIKPMLESFQPGTFLPVYKLP